MKFKGQPNLFVRISNKYVQRATSKKGLFFDNKGEYETDNELMIRVLSQNFEVVKEEVKEENNPAKLKHCKKCEFTCDNQGDLLAHYREIHPKE